MRGSLGHERSRLPLHAVRRGRSTAAELIASFPLIGEHFAARRLSLSALVPLKKILTDENLLEVLERALGRTEEEVERLVGSVLARPVQRDVARKVAPRLVEAAELSFGPKLAEPDGTSMTSEQVSFGPKLAEPTPELSDCDLLSLESTERERSRYIPVAVRRSVWNRDGGCCAFVGRGGRRCRSRRRLEFDHVVPFALGGPTNEANLRLLCGSHNQYLARQLFGDRRRGRAGGRGLHRAAHDRLEAQRELGVELLAELSSHAEH